jgi:hypothetical protein
MDIESLSAGPELVIEQRIERPGTSRRKRLMAVAMVTEFIVGIPDSVGI